MPITNRGKFRTLRALAHDEAWPAFFRVVLVSDVPTPNTKTMSELTEIAAGNGYTSGGVQITRDVAGFPAVVEDDADNLASAQIKDVPIAASGGTIPTSGGAINYAALIDDNATLANAEVWAYSYVLQDTIANGETLTLANWLLQLLEAFMSGVSNAVNIGAGGVGLFKVKNGDVLEFRNINAASPRISVALDAPDNEVVIDVNEAALAFVASVGGTASEITSTGGLTPAIGLADDPIVPGTGAIAIPGGTTAQRPGTPIDGMVRHNTDDNVLEYWNGSTWVQLDASGSAEIAVGSYTGDGNATQGITGLGFQPDSVYIHRKANESTYQGWKTDQDGTKAAMNGASLAVYQYLDDHIVSLDADGFTVGDGTGTSNVFNVNAKPYAYIAWKA